MPETARYRIRDTFVEPGTVKYLLRLSVYVPKAGGSGFVHKRLLLAATTRKVTSAGRPVISLYLTASDRRLLAAHPASALYLTTRFVGHLTGRKIETTRRVPRVG